MSLTQSETMASEPTPTTAGEPEKDLPLWAALDRMAKHEADLEDPNFDPAAHVGALDATKENIKRKVDAIEAKLNDFKSTSAKFRERVQFWTARLRAVENNEAKLKAYVQEQLQLHGYEKLAGVEHEVRLQRNSMPSMKLLREQPIAEDMVALGTKFVRMVPSRFEWDEDALYEDLFNTMKENEQRAKENRPTVAPTVQGVASIEYGHHVRFYAAKVEPVRKAKKGKA